MQDDLLAVVGPTGVGKSALALKLAGRLGGEIVSADSRQVYRRLDIGTAKPSPEDRASVPHHLIDIVDPDEDYSLALFLRQAAEAIQNVTHAGRLPILTGGTGQYVWGLLEGWQVPEVPPDLELRGILEDRAEREPEALYEELARLDPAAAERIDPRNVRRVIRALEVEKARAGPRGPHKETRYRAKLIGLTLERAELYRRIDERVDAMLAAGWLDEARGLLERGCSSDLPSLSSLGYEEMMRVLRDDMSLDEAAQRIKFKTHQLARRQYAWFRLADPRIHWFDATAGFEPVYAEVSAWMAARSSASTTP